VTFCMRVIEGQHSPDSVFACSAMTSNTSLASASPTSVLYTAPISAKDITSYSIAAPQCDRV